MALLFDEQLQRMEEIAREALADPDPWNAVVYYHEQTLELQAADRGLRELLLGIPDAPQRAAELRRRLHPLAAQIIQRAQAAGVVRDDCETQDFGVLALVMVGAVIDAARHLSPNLWRRYLTLGLQGLRPAQPPPTRPAVPALPPHKMEHLLVATWDQRS